MGLKPITLFALLLVFTLLLHGCGSERGESISSNWTGFQAPISSNQGSVEFVPHLSALGPSDRIQIVFLIKALASSSGSSSSSASARYVTVSSAFGALVEPASEATVYSQIRAASAVTSNAVLEVDSKGKVTCSDTAPSFEGIDYLTIKGDTFEEVFPITIRTSSALYYNVTMTPVRSNLSFGERTLISVSAVRSDGILPTGSLFMHTSSGQSLLKAESSGNDVAATLFDVKSGKASAVYVAGSAILTETITATYGTASGATIVNIDGSPTTSVVSISLRASVSALKTKEQTLLSLEATDAAGKPVSGQILLASSLGGIFRKVTSDGSGGTTTIATLENGKANVLFEAGPTGGTTIITATLPNANTTLSMLITNQPTFRLELIPETVTLASGTTIAVYVRIRDLKGQPLDYSSGQTILVSTTAGELQSSSTNGQIVTLLSVQDSQALTYHALHAGTAVIRATSANAEEASQTLTITD